MQTLNQLLLDSNRAQLAMMSSMQDEIKSLKGEIIRLASKSEKQSMRTIQRTQDMNFFSVIILDCASSTRTLFSRAPSNMLVAVH